MVKMVSILVVILAVIFGGMGIYSRTNTPVTKNTVDQSVTPTSSSAVLSSESEASISPALQEKGPYPMEIDIKKTYQATLTTTAGAITIELTASKTPKTVNNFVTLSRKNFYTNTIFHRIIKGFMIQGGDPKGTGTGGPGYTFDDEPFEGDYMRGTVAMANAGPNTNGSQFFIMHKDTPLPKNYVIFGRVTKGMDVVDVIAEAPTKPGGEGSTPVTPVKITSIKILEE
jgi:cyclophilin family peptidyl-prolyl cis-trans isomerase